MPKSDCIDIQDSEEHGHKVGIDLGIRIFYAIDLNTLWTLCIYFFIINFGQNRVLDVWTNYLMCDNIFILWVDRGETASVTLKSLYFER